MKKLFVVALLMVSLVACETENLAPKAENSNQQESEWTSDWTNDWSSSELAAGGRASFSDKLEFEDASRKVKVRFFYKSFPEGTYNRHFVKVPDSYVLIGGTAWVTGASRSLNSGAFLMESRPGYEWEEDMKGFVLEGESSARNSWWAVSQDYMNSDKHTLHIVAIGLKLAGVAPDVLKEHVQVNQYTSGDWADISFEGGYYNQAYASVDCGYTLVGGGARINGWRSFLQSSYPVDQSTWYSMASNSGEFYQITSYAIGISNEIPGFGSLETSIASASSMVTAGLGRTRVVSPSGKWLISCPGTGVEVEEMEGEPTLMRYRGARMIMGTEIHPSGVMSRSISKDSGSEIPGTTTAYTLLIRKAQ